MDEPDWVDDPNMSADDTALRFEALGPTATEGHHHVAATWSGCAYTHIYVDGKRID